MVNKDKRVIYNELCSELDGCTLCTFCKYAQWVGGSCCDSYPECQHPIWAVAGKEEMLEPEQDCWGFRPGLPVRDIVDIVGIILSNKWSEWSYQNTEGRIVVKGRA